MVDDPQTERDDRPLETRPVIYNTHFDILYRADLLIANMLSTLSVNCRFMFYCQFLRLVKHLFECGGDEDDEVSVAGGAVVGVETQTA